MDSNFMSSLRPMGNVANPNINKSNFAGPGLNSGGNNFFGGGMPPKSMMPQQQAPPQQQHPMMQQPNPMQHQNGMFGSLAGMFQNPQFMQFLQRLAGHGNNWIGHERGMGGPPQSLMPHHPMINQNPNQFQKFSPNNTGINGGMFSGGNIPGWMQPNPNSYGSDTWMNWANHHRAPGSLVSYSRNPQTGEMVRAV